MIDKILASPQLPHDFEQLRRKMKEEQEARKKFYEQIDETRKMEFINGETIWHSPVMTRHLNASQNLLALVQTYVELKGLGLIAAEKALTIFPRNDYEPDIIFLNKEVAADVHPEQQKFPVPDFVVEVLSPSTEKRDRTIKFEDYAINGVKEYWIVDPVNEIVEQYISVDKAPFELRAEIKEDDIESLAISGFKINVRAIFDCKIKLTELKRILKIDS